MFGGTGKKFCMSFSKQPDDKFGKVLIVSKQITDSNWTKMPRTSESERCLIETMHGLMCLWLFDKSYWSLVGMCYLTYRIQQTLHPQIFTYLDHYKIPLMAKTLTLWSIWKIILQSFLLKNLRSSGRMEYSSWLKDGRWLWNKMAAI